MKFIVYYRVRGGTTINRAYPDYPALADIKREFSNDPNNASRIYLQHEDHAVYTTEYANAGMIGKAESVIRPWLEQRVQYLNGIAAQQAQAKAANIIPATHSYGPLKPGDMTIDQNGRRGRVPNVPLEVFRAKPISPDTAMDAVRDFCKGGGGTIPKSS